ncbi:twin-arginine translocase TatA/TatE family subunit [Frigoribacterium sp. CFBP 13605]|uniref:twin-arginine translocase TatA/TatE family subunit n=1 Tax=Frigoribacterium TaxID=96492 RepID=UPI000F49E212|nr:MULTISPECIES: twin-arginine translocase TatA/TatE family subunit [Frigoribacterium]MBD8139082.1 twin-arginine translocase TatA/TatE family subunit [Frigoribacterium sp. CFBP 13605]ROS56592.1 sec-independent protein translocase protein TatA [Frigoribacterium sp. PhB118]
MFGNALSGWHLIIILAIVLLLFGAPKLPALAKSIAQSMRIFKNEVNSDKKESAVDDDLENRPVRRPDDSSARYTDGPTARRVDDSYPSPNRDVPPKS